MADPRPHSAAYFGDSRDYWWNADYIEHLAQRWELSSIRRLLDVGCGVGHWHRVLAKHLAPNAEIVALDREREWAAEAEKRFVAVGFGQRSARFTVGDAQRLPFADGSFDAVTCQTVLIHLPAPDQALLEMKRVLRPGGWVIAAEPNNLFNCLGWNDRTGMRPVEEVVAAFEFWLRYHRGKQAQGRGDNSLGERLPGLLLDAGLIDLELRQNDHLSPTFPPYDSPEQRAVVRTMEEWRQGGVGAWDLDDLRGTYFAGGGSEASLERALDIKRRWADEDAADLQQGHLREAGGSLFFLARARKPQ